MRRARNKFKVFNSDTDRDVNYNGNRVDGQYGIFRSDNVARSWVRINDDRHQWGLILQITGGPGIYGRVYVGIHGRGIAYGDPNN